MDLFFLLVLVALVISAIHMIAPDHWLPLTVIATARSYSSSRRYAVAAVLGISHAATSIIVASVFLVAGYVLVHSYYADLMLLGEAMLVAIGLYFIINGYREREDDNKTMSETSALSVSAFPDLSLMPIVISGASLDLTQISVIFMIFAISSCVSLVAMIYVAEKSVGKALSKVPPKYMDYIIGGVLIATAAFIRLF